LRAALDGIAATLQARGWRARVLADDNALVDREAAVRAGLGRYGKNTNLLIGDRGSWFVLGSVVTDALLVPDQQAAGDPCGACVRCLPACPTGALVAPGVLDARRCLAWLLEAPGVFPRDYRIALGDRIYGCDDCQEVCPPNRLEVRRKPSPPAEPGAEMSVDLLAILDEPDDAVLLERYERWYIARREARHVRRNALLALANVGDGDDEPTVSTVRRYLDSEDPLLRATAVWTAARIGRRDLLDVVTSETDPLVLAELDDLPEARSR
jgi:epoxyqueuosine reductase